VSSSGTDVVVKVVRVDGDQIKLGIDAPKEISVHREEIQQQIDAGVPPRGQASALKAALGLPE
jgi:carbon storage regulator